MSCNIPPPGADDPPGFAKADHEPMMTGDLDMQRVLVRLFALSLTIAFLSSCGSQDAGRIAGMESFEEGIPRFSGPDPFTTLKSAFTTMLDKETTAGLPRTSLADLMEEYRIPGVAVAVIDGGEIDWIKGYGTIHAGRDVAVTPDTYFEAGSTTKTLTAALVMKLAEQGLLDLDRDVNEYLVSWRIPDSPLLEGEAVTIRRLISHLSGLSEGNDFGSVDDRAPTIVDVLEGRPPATNAPATIEFTPGTTWHYSNFGFIVVQLLLEDHFDRPYADLMQEHVFGPLGMTRSTFAHHDKVAIRDEAIVPHDEDGTPHERPMNPIIKAHGDLQISPRDLARFTIALIKAYRGEPGGLFSQTTAREMLAVTRRIQPEEFFGLEGYAYGLGVFLLGEEPDRYVVGPGTNNPGTSCMLIANPGTGQGAVLMTNGSQGLLLNLEMAAGMALLYDWPFRGNED
jgi:CubicO group peptidase (beta-lactamase class C family)